MLGVQELGQDGGQNIDPTLTNSLPRIDTIFRVITNFSGYVHFAYCEVGEILFILCS